MKKILILVMLSITVNVNSQSKKEIISLMNEYSENFEKPNHNQKFIDQKLTPAIIKTEEIICESNDFGLLNNFFKMVLKTKGSNTEIFANALGEMYICKPEAVQKYLIQVYKDEFLKEILKVGFRNKTVNKENEIENYSMLKERLDKLIKTE